MESGITDNLFTVALYRVCRLIFRIIVQELMQLNDVGFQITRYYHTSLGTERDRILLKRESGRLAKAVIEYLGCKCNQVGVAVACLNIAEYLIDQAVDRLEIEKYLAFRGRDIVLSAFDYDFTPPTIFHPKMNNIPHPRQSSKKNKRSHKK